MVHLEIIETKKNVWATSSKVVSGQCLALSDSNYSELHQANLWTHLVDLMKRKVLGVIRLSLCLLPSMGLAVVNSVPPDEKSTSKVLDEQVFISLRIVFCKRQTKEYNSLTR